MFPKPASQNVYYEHVKWSTSTTALKHRKGKRGPSKLVTWHFLLQYCHLDCWNPRWLWETIRLYCRWKHDGREFCQVQHQLQPQNHLQGFPPWIMRLITGHEGLNAGSSHWHSYFPKVFNRVYFEYLWWSILIITLVPSRKTLPAGMQRFISFFFFLMIHLIWNKYLKTSPSLFQNISPPTPTLLPLFVSMSVLSTIPT